MIELQPDLLTEDERDRAAVLARNAEIRAEYRALRAAGRKVSPWLVEAGRRFALTPEAIRLIVYGRSAGERRPWMDAPSAAA